MPLLMWSVQMNEREPHSVKPGPRSITAMLTTWPLHSHCRKISTAIASTASGARMRLVSHRYGSTAGRARSDRPSRPVRLARAALA